MIVKYPDEEEITSHQLDYIKNTVNVFERVLANNEYLWDIIDIESFSKWYYASNILMLLDPNYYFYKYDNTDASLIKTGPLWDFEWSLGIGWYDGEERPNPNHTLIDSCYFKQLSKNDYFINQVKAIHSDYGKIIRNRILDYYEELSIKLAKSQKSNFERWPILNSKISVGANPLGSWESEVECDKLFFINHFDFLDDIFNKETIVNEMNISSDRLKNEDIYTLGGQKTSISNIKKGIYIKGKRKYVKYK